KMREERLVFLRKLGAEEPPPEKPPAPAPAEVSMEPKKPAKTRPEAARPLRPGGAPKGYRLRFEKTGAAALLGHLDLARELPRALRRAGVAIRYSEGYHPKPDLSFGPALSLGVASLDEYVDAKLIDAPPCSELVERLRRVSAPGLVFVDAVELDRDDPCVSTIVTSARYVIALSEDTLATFGGRGALSQKISEFIEKTACLVRRDVGGVGKMIDVRKFVKAVSVGDEASLEAISLAGIVGRTVPVNVTIAIGPSGSAKVSEVVEAIYGEPREHLGIRVALLCGSTSPLDLLPHRRVRPAATQAQI
ncbi:MAG TPA: TIGR03936 family radical SAM-associated protein, partial [Polyangiaceae bacterium]